MPIVSELVAAIVVGIVSAVTYLYAPDDAPTCGDLFDRAVPNGAFAVDVWQYPGSDIVIPMVFVTPDGETIDVHAIVPVGLAEELVERGATSAGVCTASDGSLHAHVRTVIPPENIHL